MESITFILYILLALFVAFLWLSYLRMVDVFKPETWKSILISFGLGCMSVLPILGLVSLFPNLYVDPQTPASAFYYYLFQVGLLEEITKLGAASITLYFFVKDKEPVDYIVHAAVVALGFATVENVLYLNEYGADIIRGRAGFSALAHMMNTAIPVYFYIQCKISGGKLSEALLYMLGGLALATFFHGMYDFFLWMGSIYVLAMVMIHLISIELWLTFINNMLNISPYFKKNIVADYSKIQRLLLYGFLSLSVVEFVYNWGTNGWRLVYLIPAFKIPITAMVLVLLIMTKLSKIRLIPNKKFPVFSQLAYTFNPKTFISNIRNTKFSSAMFDVRVDSINEIEITKELGNEVQLLPRDGSKNNAMGVITDKIWAFEDEVFFVFKPNEALFLNGYRSDIWLIKAQTVGTTFYKDVYPELMVLFIPVEVELNENSVLQDFDAYGRFCLVPSDKKYI